MVCRKAPSPTPQTAIRWKRDGRRQAWGPDGQLWGDEAVIESDPPRRLVHGWSSRYDPELAAEKTKTLLETGEPMAAG